jgi:hypothetical protein
MIEPGEHGSYYSQQKPAFKEKLRARYADKIVYFYSSYMTEKPSVAAEF